MQLLAEVNALNYYPTSAIKKAGGRWSLSVVEVRQEAKGNCTESFTFNFYILARQARQAKAKVLLHKTTIQPSASCLLPSAFLDKKPHGAAVRMVCIEVFGYLRHLNQILSQTKYPQSKGDRGEKD